MLFLYNTVMRIAEFLFLHILNKWPFRNNLSEKVSKFVQGQDDLLLRAREEMDYCHDNVVWVHASSYGEFQVISSVIRQLKSKGYIVVMTFFSSSGYEILRSQKSSGSDVDHVFYLPWDTKGNAKAFLDIINPKMAVFVISDYWLNYLTQLSERQIPTFFVSSVVHPDSYLLKWYGRPMLKALKKCTCMMVLDEESKQCLEKEGFKNVVVTGDPLFDNAARIAQTPYSDAVIERFCHDAADVVVAGSLSDKHDLELVSSLANRNADVKFIIVPHEISKEKVDEIKDHLDHRGVAYSECTTATDLDDVQVLIIDFMGALARIYRYGRYAYVGGGFTPYLHSVIEPVVYGVPLSFGPRIERKTAARQMMELGIAKMVTTSDELAEWLGELRRQPALMTQVKQSADDYMQRHIGATERILSNIIGQAK